jgi:hypothetical protein
MKQNKKLFSLILTLVTTILCSRTLRAQDTVGNGGDLPQLNFHFAYDSLDRYLEECLVSTDCTLQASEKKLMQKIYQSLSQEKETAQQLRFRSEQADPGFFNIEGEVKVAKTGNNIGDLIFINSDYISHVDEDGNYQPITVPQASALLLHELGHHQGIGHTEPEEQLLNAVGSKVAMNLMGSYQRVEAGFVATNLVASDVNFHAKRRDPQLWVSDGIKMQSLTRAAREQLRCTDGHLVGFNVTNLHWHWPLNLNLEVTKKFTLQVVGWGVGFCAKDGNILRPFIRQQLRMPVNLQSDASGIHIASP